MDNMNYCLSKFLLSIFLSAFTRYVCRHANKEHVFLSQTRFRQSDVWIRPERLNLDSHYQLCPVYTGPPCYVPWVIVFRSAQRCTQKSTFFCSFPSLSTLPYFALRKHWPQSPGRRVCVCGGAWFWQHAQCLPIHQHSNLSETERQLILIQQLMRGSCSCQYHLKNK